MIEIAKKLSKPFEFVRVDLYNVKGRILPETFDYEMGEKLKVKFDFLM